MINSFKKNKQLFIAWSASLTFSLCFGHSEASLGGSQPGRGGGVHGLSQQPGISADRLPACVPQNGRLPLHPQYVLSTQDVQELGN